MEEKFSIYTTFIISLFFSFTLIVFCPAYIYFTNSMEFRFSFSAVAPYLAGGAIVLAIILSALVFLLRKTFFQAAVSFLLALGVLIWIQGNLLVWSYGPLDGREIHWMEKYRLGLIDGSIWIILIALALWKAKFVYKIARTAAYGFIVIQLASLFMAYNRMPEIPSFKKYTIDESAKYSFSSKTNAVIILLDTYQTDLFQEIISEEPQYKEIFNGFTYFRNSLSVFPKTYASVPSILTGCAYDNSVPMQDFLKKAYHSETSLPAILKRNGFRVELYPYPHTENTIYFDESIASNFKKIETGVFSFEDLGFLVDISLFRQVPHFLKPLIYNEQEWLFKRLFTPTFAANDSKAQKEGSHLQEQNPLNLSKKAMQLYDIRFIRDVVNEMTVDGETPVFKYYHLNGLHRPLVLDEKLEVRQMSYSKRSSFKSQGKACLEIVRLFIRQLKSAGQFDNTAIVVMGDHGSADYPYGVILGNTGLIPDETQDKKIPLHIKASGLPLVLIKPLHAPDEELKITDAPISLKDMSATVVSLLGIIPPASTISMFNVPVDQPRERHFYYYNWSGWGNDFLYSMREYLVNGHSWLDKSWTEAGTIRAANTKTPYIPGTKIGFGRDGDSLRYLGIGWHGAGKDGFTWTREKKAELFLILSDTKRDYTLKMVLKPYLVPGKLDEQVVNVLVNGKLAETLKLTDPEVREYKIKIPASFLTGKELSIIFDIPTATAPTDLGIGNDVRNLGISVKTVIIE